jgi:S1-C subfamily serine protease
VTNAHVVAGESAVSVNGVAASVVFFDPSYDLAILRVGSVDETPRGKVGW